MMNKRLLALGLSGLLILGNTVTSFAEEDEITEITLDMVDESLYEGTWVSFDGGWDLYLPSDWDVYELTDEDIEDDIVLSAAAPDDSGQNIVVQISDIGEEGDIESLDEVKEALEEDYDDVDYYNINDIPVLSYAEENDAWGIMFLDTDMTLYNIVIAPADTEETQAIAFNIFASLSATETEDEEA